MGVDQVKGVAGDQLVARRGIGREIREVVERGQTVSPRGGEAGEQIGHGGIVLAIHFVAGIDEGLAILVSHPPCQSPAVCG